MNINTLKNRLVKKASMQKVAGPKSKMLKHTLHDIAKFRNNPKAQKALDTLEGALDGFDSSNIGGALNKQIEVLRQTDKSPLIDIFNILDYAKDVDNILPFYEKLLSRSGNQAYIDRLKRLFFDKAETIPGKPGEVFAKNLKDKYLK